jgi:hypothetical protein
MYQAYSRHERQAEADADRLAAQAGEAGGDASLVVGLLRAWQGVQSRWRRAASVRRSLAGRVVARMAFRLRHSPRALGLVVLLAGAPVAAHYAQAAGSRAPDCADALIAYEFHKTAQTTHAAYDCLAEQPAWDDFMRHSLRPSVKAQIRRQATFQGSDSTIVFFVVTTVRGDRAYTVYLNRDGKVFDMG